MGGEGEIVAVERHAGRAAALTATCARMRAGMVTVEVADAARPRDGAERFDRVLVDPPCSGLGTLQSRPDLRWRMTPEAIAGLVGVQAQILAAGLRALAPDGTLVYSVCTISAAEGARQVDAALAADPRLTADDLDAEYLLWDHGAMDATGRALDLLPHRHGTDGFSIARLRCDGVR